MYILVLLVVQLILAGVHISLIRCSGSGVQSSLNYI